MVHLLWRAVMRFFKQLKIELPHDPAVLLSGTQPENMKTLIRKDDNTQGGAGEEPGCQCRRHKSRGLDP